MTTSSDIRQQYIDFFVEKHGHTLAPSSPVVPHDDPTLLFANAGMNQFKPYFLGTEKPPYPRAVNTQKCIRAGGKHNDLEDVGRDTYHHTFFEMLGNWSFGDYFKAEAIDWAWELLVDVWGMDPQRLHATYFQGDADEGLEPDTEARDLWKKHLPDDHIHPGGKKDNFWEMGDTGPCGPCSEIHYDSTPDKSGAALVNKDDERVIEVWNLVFIQFNRAPGTPGTPGTPGSGGQPGKLTPLPAKHVDTGMGFERVTRFLQGKKSNYDTDVFTPLFAAIKEVTGARAYRGGDDTFSDPIDTAYRVIADHIRTLTFALTDGAHCGNEGRAYVLRRILRRAVKYGAMELGASGGPFFYKLVPTVVEVMGDAFPELKRNPQAVADELRDEEESFRKTLDRGIGLFEAEAAEAIARKIPGMEFQTGPGSIVVENDEKIYGKGARIRGRRKTESGGHQEVIISRDSSSQMDVMQRFGIKDAEIPAATAFKLHDTYGFPLDLTQLMAEERGMTVDVEGFNKLMEQAREVSKAGVGGGDERATLYDIVQKGGIPATTFVGYDTTEIPAAPSAVRVFVLSGGVYRAAESADTGAKVAVVLDTTPFYAEAGGQVGDVGVIQVAGGGRVKVEDTIRVGDVYFHLGQVVAGPLKSSGGGGVKVAAAVDAERRAKIMSNHTSTHLMNLALRNLVNKQTQQKGSLVDDEKLRFDFSNPAALSDEQVEKVERHVNDLIAADLPVYAKVAPQEDALKINTLRAVFGEKYPPNVRVVSIGAPPGDLLKKPDKPEWFDYSVEFCGGTHLKKTGDAEGFVIVSEEAVAKGVRRITALTGAAAHEAEAQGQMLISRVNALSDSDAEALSAGVNTINTQMGETVLPALARVRLKASIASLQDKVRQQEKARAKESAGQVVEVARTIADQQDSAVIVAEIDGADAKSLLTAMDVLRKKRPDSALLLGAVTDGKIAFVASVPKPMIAKGLKAGDWVREVAKVAGGGGGGRPDMAQAGGKDPAKLPNALETARQFAETKLQ